MGEDNGETSYDPRRPGSIGDSEKEYDGVDVTASAKKVKTCCVNLLDEDFEGGSGVSPSDELALEEPGIRGLFSCKRHERPSVANLHGVYRMPRAFPLQTS